VIKLVVKRIKYNRINSIFPISARDENEGRMMSRWRMRPGK